MDRVLDRPLERIVKLFYSKSKSFPKTINLYFQFSLLNVECNSFSIYYSPQAIFKDPFRGGNNILVSILTLFKYTVL